MNTVCMVTTNFPPVGGGVSRYNEGLVSISGAGIAVPGASKFLRAKSGEGLLSRMQQVLWAAELAKCLPDDCIIFASPPHIGLGIALARRKFIQFLHGGEWGDYPFGRFFLRIFLRRASFVVVSSLATKFRWVPQVLHPRTRVVRPGLSAVTPIVNSVPHRFHQEIDESREFKIVSVARLSPRKGTDRLIDAVKLLEGGDQQIKLEIVGSGPQEVSLRQRAVGSSCVTFVTDASDEELLEAYDSADLFALVPKEVSGGEAWEGFGIVFLEAAARGLPILSTSSGGTSEALCADGAKILAEDCSPSDIASAIRTLVENPGRRFEMSAANILWASENTWVARRAGLEELLIEVGEPET